MSNKSYQIKENSNVMKVQGGEQKVMKKILTVALSTAMAFSMFASVAFGDSAATTTQEKFDALAAKGIFNGYPDGKAHLENDMTRAEFAKVLVKVMGLKEVTGGTPSYKDAGYSEKMWAYGYIEAATAAGLLKGQDEVKQIFNYNGKVTVQEMATVLTRALKLEAPADVDNTASDWAKKDVQAAINAGLISKELNFQANATRAQLVEAAYAVDEVMSVSVKSYEVSEGGKVVTFTLTTGEVVKVTLDKALEPNKETEVKYTAKDGVERVAKVTYVVTAANKVESASASNYKELVVKFDGEVDAKTAENEDNYKVTNVSFESATLSSDKRSVTLLVAEGPGILPKQKETKLEIKGVKNSNGTKTFNETLTFTAVDKDLPEVKEAKALGTKAFKVEFSEPVTSATATNISNYRVDGKAISGYVQYTYPNIAFITTNLSVGEHTLTVSGVQDFADFKVSPVDTKLTVAEDTTAPEITSVKTVDLNKVVVEFNEPVKSVDKAYHTTASKTAEKIVIKDNKVTLSFSDNNVLSLGETTIYLQGVKDWSDNSANREAKVTPQLDTERPTATSVTSDVYNDTTKFIVDFSKDVREADIQNADNFVLKNSKGDVVVGKGFNTKGHPVTTPHYEIKNGNVNKSRVIIESVGKLAAGKYTLEISGIRDTAYIGNTMLPQSFEVDVTNTAALNVNAVWVDVKSDADDAYIDVTFNKDLAMDGVGRADEINKYSYVVGGSVYKPFPVKSTEIKLRDAKTVRITVAKKDIDVNELLASDLRVVNVADVDGNFITSTQVKVNDQYSSTIAINSVKATALNKVEVEFAGVITYVNQNDFMFNGVKAVAGAPEYDGNTTTVTFTLNDKLDLGALGGFTTVAQPASSDAYGHKVAATTGTIAIKDGIAPKAVSASTVVGDTYVNVTFSKEVNVYYTPGSFKVYVNGNSVDVKNVVGLNTKVVRVELDDAIPTGTYQVQVSATNSGNNVVDTFGNASEAIDVTAVINK